MEDLISKLPDELLHKVLLNLSTGESIRTSVLSTRWRHLWKSVPGLIFKENERDVIDFVDKFLNLHKELPIYKFTLRFPSDVDKPRVKLLIDQVLTRQVQLLTVGLIELPVSFYTCETLVDLELVHVRLDDYDGSEFINLPRLQNMHLESVSIPSDLVLEKLISCSPNLQEFSMHNIEVGLVNVRSETLRSLSLAKIYNNQNQGVYRVVIYTPKLEFLRLRFVRSKNFKVVSVSSSIKLCVDVRFSKIQNLRKFFARMSGVTNLSLSGHTLNGIYNTHSKQQHQPLPEFKNVTRLYAYFFPDISEMLPLYLTSCPNLKSIYLELHGYPKMKKIANWPVPQCLQTSIENVEIKITPTSGGLRNRKAEIEFAKYILENATTLKKLTLWLNAKEHACNSDLEKILTFRNHPSVEVKIRPVPSNYPDCYYFWNV